MLNILKNKQWRQVTKIRVFLSPTVGLQFKVMSQEISYMWKHFKKYKWLIFTISCCLSISIDFCCYCFFPISLGLLFGFTFPGSLFLLIYLAFLCGLLVAFAYSVVFITLFIASNCHCLLLYWYCLGAEMIYHLLSPEPGT